MSDSDDNMPVTFPEKWTKVLQKMPEFKEIADAASADDLKKIVVQCEGNIYTIDKEKDADTKLNGAKELVKEFSEPYRDAVKVQIVKLKYAMFLLEGKGISIDNRDETE
jgi:tricorn protease-like protein